MTTSIDQAAKKAKGLAKSFEAVLMVSDVLNRISDLDAAVEQAKSNTIKAYADQKSAEIDLQDVLDKINEATKVLNKNIKIAEQTKENSELRAKEMLDKAYSEANTLSIEMKSEYSSFRDKIERDRIAHNKYMNNSLKLETELLDRLNVLKAELVKFSERFKV